MVRLNVKGRRGRFSQPFLLVLVFALSGCFSDSTIRQRVSDALPDVTVGVVINSKTMIDCAYAELEFSESRVLPLARPGLAGELGGYWIEVNSISQISQISQSELLNSEHNIDMLGSVLVTAKNCAPNSEVFYKIVSETPGFVSTDRDGEQILLIPTDPLLPVFYLLGGI
jgi:hypothetical protein